eukprot:s777_g13.t1
MVENAQNEFLPPVVSPEEPSGDCHCSLVLDPVQKSCAKAIECCANAVPILCQCCANAAEAWNSLNFLVFWDGRRKRYQVQEEMLGHRQLQSLRFGMDRHAGTSRDSYGVTEGGPPHAQAASLVLKRLPPRCTTAVLMQVLDTICPGKYDYIHLPLDHQTHKNMSLAFLNFADHEAALRAFASLSRPSDFPEAFAPSTKVVWGAIHGLGPNLAHFLARYGRRALDPPYAPLVFQNGICVPRTQDILPNLGNTFGPTLQIVSFFYFFHSCVWHYVRDDMVRAAARFLQEQRGGNADLAVQGDVGGNAASSDALPPLPTGPPTNPTTRARKSMREMLEELSDIQSYRSSQGHVMVLTMLSRTAGRAALQAARAPAGLGNMAVRITTDMALGCFGPGVLRIRNCGAYRNAKLCKNSRIILSTWSICTTLPKLGGYDYNLGWPGSRIRNPDPEGYNDVAPPMGFGWWALIVTSVSCFFWGNTYDHSRGIKVAIGLFGPNMPI